jgi:hypothetical protein
MALLILIMKNLHQYISLNQVIIILLVISGCGKFSDGVVHEIAFPEHTPRLATTLIVNDEDEKLVAMISSSASVLDSLGPQIVQGAVITLSDESGAILYSLSQDEFNGSHYILNLDNNFVTTSGTITLTVDAPEFDEVTATTSMPSKPQFDLHYEYQGDTLINTWGVSTRDVYTLDFENNFGISKKYLIHVDALFMDAYTGDTLEWMTQDLRTGPDPRITHHRMSDGIIVMDESSSSDEEAMSEIKFSTKSYEVGEKWAPISIRVRVESLSEELANFYLSVDSHLSGRPDFFAEPSLIYSNVSSGFGCFGLASEVVILVE